MANEEIVAALKNLTADMDHQPSDEELDALLDTIATIIGFEQEGWIEKIAVSKTDAEF